MCKKILDKFILCIGCNKRYTINFIKGQKIKETKCTYCGKLNKHIL